MSSNLEQAENRGHIPANLLPHLYKKGQSGNPNGRPKGSVSLKQYAKIMLEKMTPEEREEYMQGLPKQFIWEMAEGRAETKTQVDAKIEHTVNPEVKEAINNALSEVI